MIGSLTANPAVDETVTLSLDAVVTVAVVDNGSCVSDIVNV